jgi:hypothetical protein
MLQNSFAESRGMISAAVAESGRIKMSAHVKTQGKNSWTVIQFENAPQ